MSDSRISYKKLPDTRYFISPVHGGAASFWTEVTRDNFTRTELSEGFTSAVPGQPGTDGFGGKSVKGTVVRSEEQLGNLGPYIGLDGVFVNQAQPVAQDPEKALPQVVRDRNSKGSPVRLIFPKGSYFGFTEANNGTVTLHLNSLQYAALSKAQVPVTLETISFQVGAKEVPEGSLREVLKEAAVEVLQGAAQGLRDGEKPKGPIESAKNKLRTLRDLTDLLK